jgi:hypothetical protein
VNHDRLSHLESILRREAAKPTVHFDLNVFVAENYNQSCGTTACALGLAALDPRFNSEGLALSPYGIPKFDDEAGFDAARKFFDLDWEANHHLFSADHYPSALQDSPLAVADRVRRLLEARNGDE